MGVTTTQTNKPLNPRGNDQSPLAYNRAKLFSGKALDFDGTNDNIEVADNASLDFTTAMSAFCYARVDSTSLSGDYIFAKYDYGTNNRSWLILQENKNFKIVISKNGQSSASDLKQYYAEAFQSNSEYYFIGFTFESNVLKLYLNGQEVTATKQLDSEVNAIYSGSAKLSIGSSQLSGSGANFFNGKIANARAFNVALTAAQVADLYNNPEKVVPTGVDNTALKLFLPMQEGAGTTAYDGSGNGNHGTISGATYTHGIGAPVSQTAVIDWNKNNNDLTYSQDFSQSDWNKSNVSITADQTDPIGGTAAFLFQNTAISGNYVYQTGAVDGCFSVYAKAGNRSNFSIISGAYGNGAFFDLSAETAASYGNGSLAVIESLSNDWYRCSVYVTPANDFLITLSTINGGGDAIGDNMYFAFCQIENGTSVGPYVPTFATNQPNDVLLPQGLTSGRDITGVNLFENVRKQGALNLDGNSWAEVHDNASVDVTTGLTMECWVYINDITTGGRLISKWGATQPNRSYQMFMNNALVRSLIGDGTVQAATQTTTSLSVDNWYHIAVTYNQTNLKTYLNGVEDDSQNVTFSIYNSNEPIYLGKYVSTSFESVNPIAQPRIYNRALTAAEVLQNYNSGKNTYTND